MLSSGPHVHACAFARLLQHHEKPFPLALGAK